MTYMYMYFGNPYSSLKAVKIVLFYVILSTTLFALVVGLDIVAYFDRNYRYIVRDLDIKKWHPASSLLLMML